MFSVRQALGAVAALVLTLPLFGASSGSHEVSVLVSGSPVAEYEHRGTTYIEAFRGRDFTIRITNPTPYRVAVALSVDGLNTIDAKHTTAWSAAKWVLDPYETADIDGWQVSDRTARRFFFTGERNSYGAALGQTQNLGVIGAVFYRERPRYAEESWSRDKLQRRRDGENQAAPPSARAEAPKSGALAQPKNETDDDYAATGMGRRTQHEVEQVSLELDSTPVASIALRYEFRPQLVKLGVFPPSPSPSPLERRERARGFAYCPEPQR